MYPHTPNRQEIRSRWCRDHDTRIGVIGAGELGLVTAIELADRGYQVVCANAEARSPSSELTERARRHARSGRLRFTSSRAAAARHGHIIIMAVATQPAAAGDDPAASLLSAAVEVAQNLSGPAVIVDRSAVSDAVAARIARVMVGAANHEIVVVRGTPNSEPGARRARSRLS